MNPNKKWFDLGLGLICLALWLLFREILNGAWAFFRFPPFDIWVVALPEVVSFLLGLGSFLVLKLNKRVSEFGLEVVSELSKVTWPTRKETLLSTGVIIVMVGIASLILALFDAIWGTLTKSFLEL